MATITDHPPHVLNLPPDLSLDFGARGDFGLSRQRLGPNGGLNGAQSQGSTLSARRARRKKRREKCASRFFCWSNWILSVANVCWLLAASILIYGELGELNRRDFGGCNKGLYYFGFWYVTAFYIVIGVIILVICLLCMSGWILVCMASAWKVKGPDEGN